ncbi:nitrate/nitrite transporter NarK [Streptomyces demainii]|uniref:Nitrate/nitrite transporter NarK n=1 Tax=Streptomyces demainii TaxID=588122 RepID=A0ABT9L5U7_9ACTN|nr:nitrate/nitrite transporter NarK [Streptomyces demainii]
MKDPLHLTAFQQSLLVAVPVVVGSLGRIPVGALTDRFGGRVMFPLVSAATVVPVLPLGLARAGRDARRPEPSPCADGPLPRR